MKKDVELLDAIKRIAALEIVENVAATDWLTGQKNRRGVTQALASADAQFQSVVMFDIDGLKKVNDAFGHLIGDEYVKVITARIASSFKVSDIFGRWGGDEFIAILPLNEATALEVVKRVIENVHSTPIVSNGIEIEARVSAGVAPWPDGTSLDEILALADQALYGAKAAGGSRALSYSGYQRETSALRE
jgi:diguanylate cyclase (GGDEF)-like protein